MNHWRERHLSFLMQAFFDMVVVALIILLAWGLTVSNLAATMIAGGGLAVSIVLVGSTSVVPDNLRSQATERTLRLASKTLDLMKSGLSSDGCKLVCQLLLPETQAAAVAMTDTRETLAYVGENVAYRPPGMSVSEPTRKVLDSKHMQTFTGIDWHANKESEPSPSVPQEGSARYPIGVVAPLVVSGRAVGTIKFYFRRGRDVDRTQLAIARGFSELLSTQLSTYALDRQAELTAQAEVKALQAQINPHFLFNTLNTIASFTRVDPTKARNLLREFSAFYRSTLQSSQSLIPLSAELEQTRRYLTIEKARFGESRIVESEHVEPGCEKIPVPGFLIQPIVENSVRHAMRDEGTLHIDVQVVTDGDDVMIAVADDGLGMDEDVAKRLVDASNRLAENTRESVLGAGSSGKGSAQGAGIALSNVAERVEHFYGVGSGVEIMSKPGEGTVVTLRLVNASPKHHKQKDS
ncbi:MAG: histidine kinase [Atopobiaceae bacterium]|mgnify:FL=1|jgi:two-component system sensor histidine kinase LytS|nr:histidine kinase [Atopobiaceae bacterium]